MGKDKFVVLFGSETGTAQDVAERIWREIKMLGMSGPVLAMDDYQVTQLPYETLAIFVCSTTGQGDQPANMKNFWRFLLRKNLPLNSLENLTFAVLGLGDSSYAKFNHAGKKLYRRVEMLGGRVLVPPGYADDQHDLGADAVVDPWISNLILQISTLHPHLSLPDTPPPLQSKWDVTVDRLEGQTVGEEEGDSVGLRLSWPLSSSAHKVKVVSNIRTTPPQHFQEVRVVRFEPVKDEDELKYNSGDVAVVRPCNSEESIRSLLEALSHMSAGDVFTLHQKDPDMPLPKHLASPVSFIQLASNYWDLSVVPRRSVLQVLSRLEGSSEECEMEREKLSELCSSEGQEDYFAYCTRPRRTIVELLHDFPHTARSIPPQFLFDILTPIRPRMFSIASPPQGKYVELLVGVVRYKTRLVKPRLGLCSNWLAALPVGSTLQMDIKKGSLVFPKQGQLVMVGPGTGVAPFRSYICSKEFELLISSTEGTKEEIKTKLASVGDSKDAGSSSLPSVVTLLFGCRNRAADFHFSGDLVGKPGLNLLTAFSRDQPHKIYVQHVISENSEFFGKVLSQAGTRVMVAGNAKEMPESVRQAFISCLAQTQSLTNQQAESLIESMEAKGLYQTETWS